MMQQQLTWETCRDRVAEFLGVESAEVARSTHLFNELAIDSLGIFSLGMHLIEAFGVKVPLSEVSSIATVGDLYEAMERHREVEA